MNYGKTIVEVKFVPDEKFFNNCYKYNTKRIPAVLQMCDRAGSLD